MTVATTKNLMDAQSDNTLLAYVKRCGVEFDIAVNVLFGGKLGETCSLRCATAQWSEQQSGRKGPGCWMCKFLDCAVQRDHCKLQFTDQPAPAWTYIRAGVAFGVGIAAVWSIAREVRRSL